MISNTEEQSIRYFAEELADSTSRQRIRRKKDTIGLLAFIHIGISMALRAADNPKINLHVHLKWTSRYFKKYYAWFCRNRWMRLTPLKKTWTEGLGAVGLQAFIPDRLFPLVFMVLSWSGKMLPCGF